MEKAYDPSIRKRPVCVVSNNDGAIVAMCPIAKRLGIPKFSPLFKVRDLLHKHNVVVRSSNYELYADISAKMMNVIGQFSDTQYIYSIDECFLSFDNHSSLIKSWYDYGHKIRRAVYKQTKMPVGVGFGPNLTLSKAANHAAKKLSGYDGVAVMDNDAHRLSILKRMATTDVWGIGSRLGKRLDIMDIHTGYQLGIQDPKRMRKCFSVVVERTVNELKGIRCLSWDLTPPAKKEIFSTRSFGKRITEPAPLIAALASHGNTITRKARKQGSLIKRIMVFASSSPHDNTPYSKSIRIEFPMATDNTLVIVQAISASVANLYVPGVQFYRCGVGAIELESAKHRQSDLFSVSADNPALMNCFDSINTRFGSGSMKLAIESHNKKWNMRREFLSPCYTSRWADIPTIIC